MRFEVTQTIGGPAEAVAAAYASPELYERMVGTGRISAPEVLDHVARDGRVTLHLRYRFVGDLAPAVTAVVDPAKLTWVEESVHDLGAATVDVRLHPDHYADRLRCTAAATYRADGGATIRRIEGDLAVRALLVAGAVERAIVSGLEEHLAAEAPAVEAYLAG